MLITKHRPYLFLFVSKFMFVKKKKEKTYLNWNHSIFPIFFCYPNQEIAITGTTLFSNQNSKSSAKEKKVIFKGWCCTHMLYWLNTFGLNTGTTTSV